MKRAINAESKGNCIPVMRELARQNIMLGKFDERYVKITRAIKVCNKT